MENISAIVLAAGKGTRLNSGQPSELPKVMYKICGKPMVEYTLKILESININDIVLVIGYRGDMIKDYFSTRCKYALQKEQKGTGHAVMCAEKVVDPTNEYILVIQGDDSAFYTPNTIVNLVSWHIKEKAKVSLLTLRHPNPKELGRIIRDKKGEIVAIKEKEVLTPAEKKIKEINTGTYCFAAKWLWENIKKLKPSKTGKGELILPDLIKIAVEQKNKVSAHIIDDHNQWIGVNTTEQLKLANEVMEKKLKHLDFKT